jgi:hypothetical protein
MVAEQAKWEVAGSAPRSGRGGRRFKSCHSDQLSRRSDHLRGQLCGTKLTSDNLAPRFHADPQLDRSREPWHSLPAFSARAPMRRRLPRRPDACSAQLFDLLQLA